MNLQLLGAFLSGVGSVIGAVWAIRMTQKRDDEDCEKRMNAFREGLDRNEEDNRSGS